MPSSYCTPPFLTPQPFRCNSLQLSALCSVHPYCSSLSLFSTASLHTTPLHTWCFRCFRCFRSFSRRISNNLSPLFVERNMTATEGLVPQRQAPPPPRPATNKSLSLQMPSGAYRGPPPPKKGGAPPPQKPSRQNDNRYTQESIKSSHSGNTITLHSSPKMYNQPQYDSPPPDYTPSSRSLKGVFSNFVNSVSGKRGSAPTVGLVPSCLSTDLGYGLTGFSMHTPPYLTRPTVLRQKDGDLFSLQPCPSNPCRIQPRHGRVYGMSNGESAFWHGYPLFCLFCLYMYIVV